MSRRLTAQLLLGVMLSCLLGLSGCRWFRSSDPLDWEIEGNTAIRLQEWLLATGEELPAELSQEFLWAFTTVANTTPNWKTVEQDSPMNPLCVRVRGMTIRNLIIEAYDFHVRSCYSRIGNEQQAVLRYVQLNSDQDRTLDEEHKYQIYLEKLNRRIAETKHEVDKYEKRIEELRASRTP